MSRYCVRYVMVVWERLLRMLVRALKPRFEAWFDSAIVRLWCGNFRLPCAPLATRLPLMVTSG